MYGKPDKSGHLGILWISVCSFWPCGSIVANPIIYRLIPSPSRYVIRQWHFLSLNEFLLQIHWQSARRLFWREGGTGGKSPFSLLSEPISPSSLLFWANFSLLLKRLRFFFSLLPTFSPYFSLLPTFFGPFLPPPYSVPPPSFHLVRRAWRIAKPQACSYSLCHAQQARRKREYLLLV